MPNDVFRELEEERDLRDRLDELVVENERLRLHLSSAIRLRDDLAAENASLKADCSDARKAVVRACEEIARIEQEIPCAATLSGGHAHVYVTRTATLEFCALTRLHFEESRRALTRLLLHAEPVPGDRRRWTLRTEQPYTAAGTFVAYVVPDGDLLVVGNVKPLAQDAQDAYGSAPPRDNDTRGPALGVYSPAQLKK